jgi:hypothetical protein
MENRIFNVSSFVINDFLSKFEFFQKSQKWFKKIYINQYNIDWHGKMLTLQRNRSAIPFDVNQ